ncbi:MAG: hypothetical protein V4662_17690 [Verrucomicrobiota bacterium]
MAKKRSSKRPRSPIQQAVEIVRRTSTMTTAMSARETAALTATMRKRVFWSARTTKAKYVEELHQLVERATRGEGDENDLGQLRLEARRLLAKYGYTPEKGFPGDAKRGIPAAMPGTLRDLRSEARLNLIFNTQAALARGLGQKLRGLSRLSAAPAWELTRLMQRAAPRDWEERWVVAGGSVNWVGVYSTEDGRMIARKTSPIWEALGSRALFEDALNVDHAPFALNSGMGWLEMMRSDLEDLRLVNDRRKPSEVERDPDSQVEPIPTAEEAIEQMPEVQEPETEEVPEYVNPDDFIGGQKTVDKLLENLQDRIAAWKQERGL